MEIIGRVGCAFCNVVVNIAEFRDSCTYQCTMKTKVKHYITNFDGCLCENRQMTTQNKYDERVAQLKEGPLQPDWQEVVRMALERISEANTDATRFAARQQAKSMAWASSLDLTDDQWNELTQPWLQ